MTDYCCPVNIFLSIHTMELLNFFVDTFSKSSLTLNDIYYCHKFYDLIAFTTLTLIFTIGQLPRVSGEDP